MKQTLRNRISSLAGYLEVLMCFILLLGILFISLSLFRELYEALDAALNGASDFDFGGFLNMALKLIIGIEFVKMLSKHSPESVIEVLLFAIARKLIIDVNTSLDIVLGVLSITVLFALRKYLLHCDEDRVS